MYKIACNINNPSVFRYKEYGRVDYMEFENDIWIVDVYAKSRGAGAHLARAFIAYAKKKNKNIYGAAKAKYNITMMGIDRLLRWYERLGGERIVMKDHPYAMRLMIKGDQNG